LATRTSFAHKKVTRFYCFAFEEGVVFGHKVQSNKQLGCFSQPIVETNTLGLFVKGN
jgi:hypothetical protein